MKFLKLILPLLPLCFFQHSLSAREDRQLDPIMQTTVDSAEKRGQQMYLYDQAAWHGTDRFLPEFDAERLASYMRGYVVTPRDDELLDVIFFGDFGQGLVEVARYTVEESAVVDGGIHPESDRPPLSTMATRMAQARQAALSEAGRRGLRLCADANPNTIVLPPDPAGMVEVYILTPPTSNNSYPLGGHHRMKLDSQNKVISTHTFIDVCSTMLLPQMPSDAVMFASTTVTHEPDPQPTEIHVFASYHRIVPLALFTPKSGIQWFLDRGQILPIEDGEKPESEEN